MTGDPDAGKLARVADGSIRLQAGGVLKACVNGSRSPVEHARLPVTPAQLAGAAAEAVFAGADALHIHPKDDDGHDTLDPVAVAAAVSAVRAAVPGVPIGVTTGAWAVPGPRARTAAVRGWTVLPDFASVNWHEPGAVELAALLMQRGVGVEAGLWTPEAVAGWVAWPRRESCLRVLVEVVDDLPPSDAVAAAHRLLGGLPDDTAVAVLLHGEGESAWPVLSEAARRGLHMRIGLEDVLHLPDGRPASGNAELIHAAQALAGSATSP